MTDLTLLSLSEISDLIVRHEITSTALVTACLKRIEETESSVHAYAYIGAEQALEAAERADRGPVIGPLHGVPFAVKDVLNTRDMPTEANSRVLRGHRPETDAFVVEKLRAAGAILIGKHVTHEFATGQDNPPTRNPWKLDCYPGGSSAGGGASTAVRSCQFALGTDAGGSVRVPAAVTGVVGFKPTFGRVSTAGTVRGATVPTVEHIGIFSRSVEDAMQVLAVIAGADPGDPRTWSHPRFDTSMSRGDGIAGIRIGVPRLESFGPDPDATVSQAFADGLAVLQDLGAILVDVEIDRIELAVPAATAIITSEIGFPHRAWITDRPDLYTDEVRQFLELSIMAPAGILHAAYRARNALQRSVSKTFREAAIQAVFMPSFPRVAMPLAELDPETDMTRLIQYTCPWSLVGQPAISIPGGFSADGLPVGLQIVTAPFDEGTAGRIASAYQRVTAWHRRHPPQ